MGARQSLKHRAADLTGVVYALGFVDLLTVLFQIGRRVETFLRGIRFSCLDVYPRLDGYHNCMKKARGERFEFTEKTKQILAGRSGYQCSFPACSKLKSGPAMKSGGVSMTGKAAHIFSAAKHGPRGQGDLTEEQLKSPENAIWLCSNHATEIDNRRGDGYPPAVLVSLKGLHEASIARKHRGIYAPLGWIHELRITGGTLFKTPATIRFGQVTFIAGGNASGRSALCEWLASVTDPTWALQRWRHVRHGDQPICFELTGFNPAEYRVGVQVLESGKTRFQFNDNEVPYNPASTKFFTITSVSKGKVADHEKDAWDAWGDLRRISSVIRVDVTALENILSDVGSLGRTVKKIWVDEPVLEGENSDGYEPRSKLMVKLEYHEFSLPFFELASSEQMFVLFEIGITLASFSGSYVPTVLILDDFSVFQGDLREEWLEEFSSSGHLFQTVVEVACDPEKFDLPLRPDWQVVSLVGARRNVAVCQFGGE